MQQLGQPGYTVLGGTGRMYTACHSGHGIPERYRELTALPPQSQPVGSNCSIANPWHYEVFKN